MQYLFDVIIGSLIFIYDLLFTLIHRSFANPAVSIIVLSITINFFVLPLYTKADSLQKEEQAQKVKMEPMVKHIRKAFKNDEQFMMLNAYYRECNYSPLSFIKEAVPLLLQIPFFIAAYRYISSLAVLNGASFGPIDNLIEPDRMLVIGSLSINILPIIMTLINLVSGCVYSKGSTKRLKIQIIITALIFLALLYNSPSGLVVYWTMNNVFSLVKNLVMTLPESKKRVVKVITALVILGTTETLCIMLKMQTEPAEILVIGSIAYILLILGQEKFKSFIDSHYPSLVNDIKGISNRRVFMVFILSVLSLVLLLGLYVPSTVLVSSVYEFYNSFTGLFNYELITYPIAIYAGILLLWLTVVYFSCSKTGRIVLSVLSSSTLVFSVLNQFVFSRSFGTLYPDLRFDEIVYFPMSLLLINSISAVIVLTICTFIFTKRPVVLNYLAAIIAVTIVILSGRNILIIRDDIRQIAYRTVTEESYEGILRLSRTQPNVIVFMLDRAIGGYIPYIFDEKPELLDSYSGFTYYPNTISFGRCTNIGAPSLFGGYEYTPDAINRRSLEPIADKYNQALLLMPILFSRDGFDVAVTDPPYAGYSTPADLSIYDEYPGIRAYCVNGKFSEEFSVELGNGDSFYRQKRNFVMYSIFRTAPVILRKFVYDQGNYISNNITSYYPMSLIDSYSTLTRLVDMTSIDDYAQGGFLLLQNETPHNPAAFTAPDYEINSNYLASAEGHAYYGNRFYEGRVLEITNDNQWNHYSTNIATYQQLAIWLDYLKEQGVYDNTRIILVSDHGYPLGQFADLLIPGGIDVEGYMPLLMVKDFNSNGPLTTDYTFMTNADVPTLAMEGIIGDPVNPFTGNPISSDAKFEDVLYVTSSYNWGLDANDGYSFDLSDGSWWAVRESLYDLNNWVRVSEEEVFS